LAGVVRALIAFLAVLIATPAIAQSKVSRIGFLGLSTAKTPVTLTRLEAFRAGLRELGYVEGKNISLEFRWADNDYGRLPGLAEELVRAKVDILVTYATPGAMAARKATRSIPIVLASVGDPVSTGLVPNLARPGGNITGLAMFTPDEMAKRVELLKDALPDIQRIAVLINPNNASSYPGVARARQVAGKLKVHLLAVEARGAADFERAVAEVVKGRAEALVVHEDPIFTAEGRKLIALTIRHRLPTIGAVSFAETGGMIGNGVNQNDLFHRAAGYVDQIIKGARPADLAIQQPARFELVVNQSTLTALGVTLPKAFLFRTDRIID